MRYHVLRKRQSQNNSIGLRPKRAVICSISHAWEAREHPDPCGHQLPGRMPHALEYVIQNAIFIYFHANPEVFRQADWWVKAQVPEGANHPYTYETFFLSLAFESVHVGPWRHDISGV